MTYREAKYVSERIAGKNKTQAALAAGFSPWIARCAGTQLESPEMIQKLAEIESELTANMIEHSLVNASEIHEQLTDELRGDIAELYNPSDPTNPRFNPSFAGGDLLPIECWPMWARNGGVEVLDEPNMVHSDDEGGGSWDQKGRRIKVKMAPRHKAKELAMKHVAVRAMQQDKAPELHVHLHAEVTRRLQAALARHERVIDAEKVEP